MDKKILVIVGSINDERKYPRESVIIESVTTNKITIESNNEMFLGSVVKRYNKKFDALIIDDGLEDWIKFNNMDAIIKYILKNIIKENGIILLYNTKVNYPIQDSIRKIYNQPKHINVINKSYIYINNSNNPVNESLLNNGNTITEWYNLNRSPFDLDILNIDDRMRNDGTAPPYSKNQIGVLVPKYINHCLLISINQFIVTNINKNCTVEELRKIGHADNNSWPPNRDFDTESKYGKYQVQIINNIAKYFNLQINIHGSKKIQSFQENQRVYNISDLNHAFPQYTTQGDHGWIKNKPYNIKFFIDILSLPGHFELLNWKTYQKYQYDNSSIKNKYLKYKRKYMAIKQLV